MIRQKLLEMGFDFSDIPNAERIISESKSVNGAISRLLDVATQNQSLWSGGSILDQVWSNDTSWRNQIASSSNASTSLNISHDYPTVIDGASIPPIIKDELWLQQNRENAEKAKKEARKVSEEKRKVKNEILKELEKDKKDRIASTLKSVGKNVNSLAGSSSRPSRDHSSECHLKVRDVSGNIHKRRFSSQDLISDVFAWLDDQITGLPRDYELLVPFPRQVLSRDRDSRETLISFNLTPSAQLFMQNISRETHESGNDIDEARSPIVQTSTFGSPDTRQSPRELLRELYRHKPPAEQLDNSDIKKEFIYSGLRSPSSLIEKCIDVLIQLVESPNQSRNLKIKSRYFVPKDLIRKVFLIVKRKNALNISSIRNMSQFMIIDEVDLADYPLASDRLLMCLIDKFTYSIRSLNLKSCNELTEKGLMQLKKLKNLKNLNISNCRVGDTIVPYFFHLPCLESLNLSNTHITSASIESIANLKELNELNLSGCKISSKQFFSYLGGAKKLQKLFLNNTDLCGPFCNISGQILPNLRVLRLNSTSISDDDISVIKNILPNLHTLDISETRVKMVYENLRQSRCLEEIKLPCELEDVNQCMEVICDNKLENLNLRGMKRLDDIGGAYFSLNGNIGSTLLSLDLGMTSIGDDTVSNLGNLPLLQQLFLERCKNISNQSLDKLKSFSSLKILSLSKNDQLNFSKWLDEHSNLDELLNLNVSFTKFGDNDLKQLYILKRLNSINLIGSNAAPDTINLWQQNSSRFIKCFY